MIVGLVFHWIKDGEITNVTERTFDELEPLLEFELEALEPLNAGIVNVYPVNRSFATAPPPGFRLEDLSHFWCPYCANEREFIYDSNIESTRCEICGISDRDYHYRDFNGLIPSARKGERNDNPRRNGQLRQDNAGDATGEGPEHETGSPSGTE